MTAVTETVLDLSSLNLHCNPHSKSSLRNILTEYGLKEGSRRRQRKVGRKPQSAVVYKDKEKDDKQKRKEEKHLQVLKDMDVLKHHYYQHYMDLLRERIRLQEEKMKEREARIQNTQKNASSPAKNRKQKHTLVNDQEYLHKVTKSQVYEIVREEARLLEAGELRTSTDLEEFWSRMMLRSAMREMSRRYKISDISALDESVLDDELVTSRRPRLTNITEDEEEVMSRKTTSKVAGRKITISQKGTTSKKAPKDLDEILFPKVEMPQLHCFNMQVGPQEEDPVMVQQEAERSSREKERWLFRKRLQKMYQLAMTNTASAKRIMANHDEEDMEIMMDSTDVKELINMDYFITKTDRYASQSVALVPYRGQGSRDSEGALDSGQGQSTLSREMRSEVSEEVRDDSLSGPRRAISCGSESSSLTKSKSSAKSRQGSRARSETTSKSSPGTPAAPLSMGDVLPEARIMEAKCLSTLWSNYLTNQEDST